MTTPTQLSMEMLKVAGWNPVITEVNMRIKRKDDEDLVFKKDLFGFIDIIALKGPHTLGVQTTSNSNVAARIKKIQCIAFFDWCKQANWMIHVHGWDLNNVRTGVRVVDMTGRDASGAFIYETLWSTILLAGKRSKKRPRNQVELAL